MHICRLKVLKRALEILGSRRPKKQGDFVRAGEAIAVLGNTGEETTGPHLHFELWQAGKALNPETFIKFK